MQHLRADLHCGAASIMLAHSGQPAGGTLESVIPKKPDCVDPEIIPELSSPRRISFTRGRLTSARLCGQAPIGEFQLLREGTHESGAETIPFRWGSTLV